MTVEQTVPFRDKERMKQVLDAAGIRTPWHVSATTVAEVWEAAERIGYPLIVKPIAGAGSADTYRVDSAGELGDVLPMLRHVAEVSVEEFVDGEEFTYDTVCAGGSILFENIMWYRPRPLQMKQHEWISPVSIVAARPRPCRTCRRPADGRATVLAALGFRTGFTHMEWYRKADGEVGVRRDRSAAAGRPGGRPDELRHRRRPVRRRGRRRSCTGGCQPTARAALQRRHASSSGPGRRADHPRRGAGPAAGRVRRARRARRPAADRRPPPRLAGHRSSATG